MLEIGDLRLSLSVSESPMQPHRGDRVTLLGHCSTCGRSGGPLPRIHGMHTRPVRGATVSCDTFASQDSLASLPAVKGEALEPT